MISSAVFCMDVAEPPVFYIRGSCIITLLCERAYRMFPADSMIAPIEYALDKQTVYTGLLEA